MININLIIREKPKINWRRVGAVAGAGTLAVAFGVYALTWWFDYSRLQQDLAGLEPLAATYRNVIAQSTKLKEQEDAVQRQAERLAQIGRNQAPQGQAAILQAIFAAAPADVTVTEAAVDKEQVLLLTGQGPDFEAALRYLRALQALPSLAGVEERKLATVGRGVTTFTFAARLRREGTP